MLGVSELPQPCPEEQWGAVALGWDVQLGPSARLLVQLF